MNKHIRLENTLEKTMNILERERQLSCGAYLAKNDNLAFVNGIIIVIKPHPAGRFTATISDTNPIHFSESKHNTRIVARRHVLWFLEEKKMILP